ncbi:hypothetical protein [Pseudaminobacter sp. NGMCC 1.201702]
MLIYMLAAAMTITMMIATAFAIHQESERLRHRRQETRPTGFGPRR